MENSLVVKEQSHITYIDNNLALIANQNKLSGDDLKNFAIQCKRTGLDPITRQIYAIPNNGKLTIMASIDGLRLIAERSGKYEGQTPAMWCGEDGKWVDVWINKSAPKACKVGVYKNGFREALYATALYDEYCQPNGFMWKKMPALMISKVAESLALRKAFPNEMSGIYSQEEMDQSGIAETSKEARDVAPVANNKPLFDDDNNGLGEFTINFGLKHKGKKIKDMQPAELKSYILWLENSAKEKGQTLSGQQAELAKIGREYLESVGYVEPPKQNNEEKIPI